MSDSETQYCVGIMEDIWHEMGADIVQWLIDNTDFWENDLIYPFMDEDEDPADIDWDEIFYDFLDRFKGDAHADEEHIQITRVVYGDVGFLLDTEHMGGHKYRDGATGVSDIAITSWTYSNDAYLGAVFGNPGSDSEEGVDHDRIIIDGMVSTQDVDWPTTIAMNISSYWQEKEIVIPDGTKLWNIDILRNGEPMTTMEEGFAADWGNTTVTAGVDDIDEMLGRGNKYTKKMPVGRWASESFKDRIKRLSKEGKLSKSYYDDPADVPVANEETFEEWEESKPTGSVGEERRQENWPPTHIMHWYDEDGNQMTFWKTPNSTSCIQCGSTDGLKPIPEGYICKSCHQESMAAWQSIFGRKPNWEAESIVDKLKKRKEAWKDKIEWDAEDSIDEMIEKVSVLNEAWNKDVDPAKVAAAKKGAKSDYVGQWVNTPKLPKNPPAGQSWCALQPFYDTLVIQDKKRKSKYKRLGTPLKPPQQLIVTDGAGIGNSEFVVGPRGTDVSYKQYQRKCNKCNQSWVASQKDVDNGNKAKERCWKCGEKNNYTEQKKNIAYREIKFPVTTPGCNDTIAYVSLTGQPAKQLESVLRPGSIIEVQGWIKPAKEWKYKNNKKFLVDALLITLGSTQHGGYVKLIKR